MADDLCDIAGGHALISNDITVTADAREIDRPGESAGSETQLHTDRKYSHNEGLAATR